MSQRGLAKVGFGTYRHSIRTMSHYEGRWKSSWNPKSERQTHTSFHVSDIPQFGYEKKFHCKMQSINKNKKLVHIHKIMKYVKAESEKVFLEWDIGESAESNLKTQCSLAAPHSSLMDVLSLPQSMVANGRILPNLPWHLSVVLVSVHSQNRGATHMVVRAITNRDYPCHVIGRGESTSTGNWKFCKTFWITSLDKWAWLRVHS